MIEWRTAKDTGTTSWWHIMMLITPPINVSSAQNRVESLPWVDQRPPGSLVTAMSTAEADYIVVSYVLEYVMFLQQL